MPRLLQMSFHDKTLQALKTFVNICHKQNSANFEFFSFFYFTIPELIWAGANKFRVQDSLPFRPHVHLKLCTFRYVHVWKED